MCDDFFMLLAPLSSPTMIRITLPPPIQSGLTTDHLLSSRPKTVQYRRIVSKPWQTHTAKRLTQLTPQRCSSGRAVRLATVIFCINTATIMLFTWVIPRFLQGLVQDPLPPPPPQKTARHYQTQVTFFWCFRL